MASLAPIVRAFGGDLYAGGRRASIPGPGHGRADRSVSLLLSGDRVVVHCFAGDDWRDVLAALRARGLIDPAGRLTGAGGDGRAAGDPPSRPERLAAARALWAEARGVGGTLSERHARLRGVAGPLPDGLRHHGGVPAGVYARSGPRRPALLAALRDVRGDLCGVEITYLAADGARARLPVPRKIVGGCPPGAAVRLGAAGPRLLVGEGVFTCLSAAAVFRRPAWALLSAGNLAAWRPPPGVRAVMVAADRGPAGEAAAARLAGRLRALGVAVEVRGPPAPYGDWNEAVRGSAVGEDGGRTGSGGRGGRMVRAAGPDDET